jgi:hypothetical protein
MQMDQATGLPWLLHANQIYRPMPPADVRLDGADRPKTDYRTLDDEGVAVT